MIYYPEEAELSPQPPRDWRGWIGPALMIAGALLAGGAALFADGRL